MMAKGIELAATSAGANSRREGKAESAQARRERGGEESEWGSLMAWRTTQHPRTRHSVTSKEPSHCRSTPASTCALCGCVPLWMRPRVAILSAKNLARTHLERRARTMQDSMPRGWLETHDTRQLFTSRMGGNQRRWSCTNSETLQECACHIAVSVVEHAQ